MDLYLLHEAMPADARRDDLGAFLEDQVGRGRIRYFGAGSAFAHLQNDLGQFPVAYRVFQFDEDPIRQNMSALASVAERGIITSGSLKASQPRIQAAAVHPELPRRHSEQAGVDLADPQIVWRLLLPYTLQANPYGITLFVTTRREHWRENMQLLAAPAASPEQLSSLIAWGRAALASWGEDA